MILAMSGQQAVGIGVGIAVLAGWAIFVAVNLGRPARRPGSEIEDAPNRRPYLDDDQLETRKLDKALTWGLLTLAFIAIGLPVYWLAEPGREDGAIRGFDKRSVNRGAELFQSTTAPVPPGHIAVGCADCHGPKGEGGVKAFVMPNPTEKGKVIPVTWKVPSLNDVLLRFDETEVKEILTYGRPPTPMPAWGVAGGGALGDQQINDLISFLKSIQITPKEARAKVKDLSGGAELFDAMCSRCHTLGWSYKDSYQEPDAKPGGGAYGPSLRDGRTVEQFPVRQDQIDFITEGSVFGKNFGRRGIGTGRMPGFGSLLTKKQIEAIVDYERSL